MKRITIRMPDELHEELRRISYETRESINNLLLKYVEQGVKNEDNGK